MNTQHDYNKNTRVEYNVLSNSRAGKGRKMRSAVLLLLVAALLITLFSVQLARAGDGTVNEDNPITGLKLVKTTNKNDNPPSCGTGWSRIDTNLQAGGLATGSGSFKEPAWYLCYQTGDPADAITHLYPISKAHVGSLGRDNCYGNDVKVKDQNGDSNVNAEGWKVQSDYLCYGTDGDYPLLGIKIKTYLGFFDNYELQKPNDDPQTGKGETGQTFNFGGTLIYIYTRDQSTTDDDFTFDCGGEGEKPCTIFTSFWWENGNFACDRGLREWGGECINGLLGLNRYDNKVNDFLEGSANGDWVTWALDNQRTHLAIDEPLNWVTHVGSHNSFNNQNDSYIIDSNQEFSLTDQLTLGARFVLIDLHFYNGDVRLCHGKDTGAGCLLTDRLYFNIIKELGTWLDRNPDEFVFVGVEEYLDGNDSDAVNFPIEKYVGDKVYRHEDYASVLTECLNGTHSCSSSIGHRWPTIRELRAAGKQVMFSGSADFGDEFFTLGVHDPLRGKYGLVWNKADRFFGSYSGSDTSSVDPNPDDEDADDKDPTDDTDPTVDCLETAIWANNSSEAAISATNGNELTVYRVEEDRTWNGTFVGDWPGLLNAERVAKLAQCNIWISMDKFGYQEGTDQSSCDKAENKGLVGPCTSPDGRLKAAVWSWREDDYGLNGDYAMLADSDKRWVSSAGDNEYHFACAYAREEDDPTDLIDREGKNWKVTAGTGPWSEGSATCAAEFGTDYLFNVPVNGWQNEKLKEALADAKVNTGDSCSAPCYDTASNNVWLNYRKDGTQWIPGRSPEASIAYSAASTGTPTEGYTTTFSNSAINDGVTLTYDWSIIDSTGAVIASSSAEVYNYTFDDNGSFTIDLTVTDEAGLQAIDTTSLTVHNADPTADFGDSGDVDEGSVGQVAFTSQADPSPADQAAGFTYSYDFDSDGSFELVDDLSSTADVPAAYLDDGPGTQTVTGRIKDKDSGYTDYTTNITINNVPPAADFGNNAGEINEGLSAALFANPTDPSTTDVTEVLRYIYGGSPRGEQNTPSTDPSISGTLLFDCNDDPLDEFRYADGVDAGQSSCIFIDGPSIVPVSARIVDKDEGWREYTGSVLVRNVPPDVHTPQINFTDTGEGTVISASASFTDPGVLDEPLTCTVNYGDGTGPKTGTIAVSEALVEIVGTCTGPNHVYADNGNYNVTVVVTDKDHGTLINGRGSNSTTFPVSNVAPAADAGNDLRANEGAVVSLASAKFNDKGTLDTHTASIDWGDGTSKEAAVVSESPFGPPGSPAGANGTIQGSHVYADNGSYTIEVCVRDDEGGENCDTAEAVVKNVAPTVNAGLDVILSEAGTFLLAPASFNDKGTLDTHTATINWGDGLTTVTSRETPGIVVESPSGPPGLTSGGDGTVAGSFTYGDNGTYTVEVCVTDDDQATTCDQVEVQVNNVNPTVSLDKRAAIQFADGPAFLARRGEEQSFNSTASDVGSDDLTFKWTFPPSALGSQTITFNDGSSPDPQHSPHGVYPFDASDSSTTTFDAPGVYKATITVGDDDAGKAADSLRLLLTDSRECTAVHAVWGGQYGPGGQQTIDDQRLQGYLDIIRYTSAYFDAGNLANKADAAAIFRANGGNGDQNLKQHALAAWLNYASGGVLWDQEIPHIGQPFHEVIAEIDTILLNANATKTDRSAAQLDAIRINTMSPGNSSCNDPGTP